MLRHLCFLALVVLSSLVTLGLMHAAQADEPAAAPGDGALLERLSAETASLAELGANASAQLISAQGVWLGVLVGTPTRFVLALDPATVVAELPRTAKLRQAQRPEADLTLLDADSDLGLAIYSITGTPRAGLVAAEGSALRRGVLAVVADAPEPRLLSLGASEGPLEDLAASDAPGGVALLAPGGALLGLAPSSALANQRGCTACHIVDVRTEQFAGRSLSGDGTPASGAAPTSPRLAALRSKMPGDPFARWIHSPNLHTFTNLAGQAHVCDGSRAAHQQPGGAFVPGPVIARALADAAAGQRLGRAYLGVLPESSNGDVFVVGGDNHRMPRVVRIHGYREAGADAGAAWLAGPDSGFVRLAQVIADSPAAKAGLRGAQDILALDGVEVRGATHFARMLARRRPGETVTLSMRGLAEPVKIVLGDREKEGRSLATALSVGLEVQALTTELSAFLGVKADEGGVVVRAVTPDGAAAKAGLQRGDVIRDGGGGPIRDLAELDAVLGAAKDDLLLGFERQGQRFAVKLHPPKAGGGLLPR